MNFIYRKINRFKLPPIFLLLIIMVAFGLDTDLSGDPAVLILLSIALVAAVNIGLYFLIQVVTHKIIKNDLLSIVICSGFSELLSGKIFRIMHWQGATTYFYLGVFLLLMSFFLSVPIISDRNKKP